MNEVLQDVSKLKRSTQFFNIDDDEDSDQEKPEQKCARIGSRTGVSEPSAKAPATAWEGAGFGIYVPAVAKTTATERMATVDGGALENGTRTTTTTPSIAEVPDMSLMRAFNLRDTDEIDRRVANFADGALQQQTIDTDRDMATALQMSFDEPPNELRTCVPDCPARVETAKGESNFVQPQSSKLLFFWFAQLASWCVIKHRALLPLGSALFHDKMHL